METYWYNLFPAKENFISIGYKVALFFGLWKLFRFTLSTLGIVWQYLIMKIVPNNLYLKYGSKLQKSWVLVTGASDGIGLAMCKVLAKDHGFNILMLSRNEGKLGKARDELLAYCGNRVEVQIELQDLT